MNTINLNDPKWMKELLPENIGKYSDEYIVEFLTTNYLAIPLVKDMKEEWVRAIVSQHPAAAQNLKNPPRDIQEIVIASSLHNAAYLRSIDEDLALECVLKDPDFVKYANVPELARNVATLTK